MFSQEKMSEALELLKRKPQMWGLAAPEPIMWLLFNERDVYARVEAFIGDMASNRISVAGPPTREDLRKKYMDPLNPTIGLPTVTLFLKKVKHHLTGQPGVEVTCTDGDLVEIIRWMRIKNKRVERTQPIASH